MARYYLDTNVLEGLTFLHDAWSDEAERLFDTDNSLYIGQGVLYEYCNDDGDDLEETDLDWETEQGRFGDKFSKVRLAQRLLDTRMDSYADDELDLDTLVDEFLRASGELTDKPDTGTDEALLDEYTRPRIRAFLQDVIDGREIDSDVASEAMRDLCYTIQSEARRNREEIRNRVTEKNVDISKRKQYLNDLSYVNGFIDKIILGGVAYLSENDVLHRIVSSDGSHMYGNRNRLRADHDIVVLFIKDEFAEPPKME